MKIAEKIEAARKAVDDWKAERMCDGAFVQVGARHVRSLADALAEAEALLARAELAIEPVLGGCDCIEGGTAWLRDLRAWRNDTGGEA